MRQSKNTDRAAYRAMATLNDELSARLAAPDPMTLCNSCDAAAAEPTSAAGYCASCQDDAAGYDADAAYERYLEDGGPAAERIAAEDDYERQLEAMDPGLSAMRTARQEREDAARERTLQTRCPAPLCDAKAGEECGRGAAGTDRWDGLHQARWLIADR
jgi:hypothetical protein